MKSWRVICLLILVLVAVSAESVTLASEDYTEAHIVAGAALAVAGVLAYLWWKLLGVITRLMTKLLAALVLCVLVWQFGVVAR